MIKTIDIIKDCKDIFWIHLQDTGVSREVFDILWKSIIKDVDKRITIMTYPDIVKVQEIVNTNFFEDPRNQ